MCVSCAFGRLLKTWFIQRKCYQNIKTAFGQTRKYNNQMCSTVVPSKSAFCNIYTSCIQSCFNMHLLTGIKYFVYYMIVSLWSLHIKANTKDLPGRHVLQITSYLRWISAATEFSITFMHLTKQSWKNCNNIMHCFNNQKLTKHRLSNL